MQKKRSPAPVRTSTRVRVSRRMASMQSRTSWHMTAVNMLPSSGRFSVRCRPARLPRRGSFRTPRGAPVVRLGGSGLAIGCAGPQGHAAPEGGPGMIQELLPQAERIGAILKARGETVSVAESSTAGLISAALLAVGGASAYFMGGAVVYTRASRTELLRVTQAELAAMTGITPSTEPYALLLARKIKERLDTTWALGQSGPAG